MLLIFCDHFYNSRITGNFTVCVTLEPEIVTKIVKNRIILAPFCLVSSLSHYHSNLSWKIWRIDVVLGIRIQGRRMLGTDGSTELWRYKDCTLINLSGWHGDRHPTLVRSCLSCFPASVWSTRDTVDSPLALAWTQAHESYQTYSKITESPIFSSSLYALLFLLFVSDLKITMFSLTIF